MGQRKWVEGPGKAEFRPSTEGKSRIGRRAENLLGLTSLLNVRKRFSNWLPFFSFAPHQAETARGGTIHRVSKPRIP